MHHHDYDPEPFCEFTGPAGPVGARWDDHARYAPEEHDAAMDAILRDMLGPTKGPARPAAMHASETGTTIVLMALIALAFGVGLYCGLMLGRGGA